MSNAASRRSALFQRYLNGTLSRSEYEELLALLHVDTISEALQDELRALWLQPDGNAYLPNETWDKKLQALLQQTKPAEALLAPVKQFKPWYRSYWTAAAAVFVFFISCAAYFFSVRPTASLPSTAVLPKTQKPHAGTPGANKAVLVLADGSSVVLDDSPNSAIASQGNTKVIKLPSGRLVYNSAKGASNVVLYNTLSTPVGGQYQVTLADGTAVWLNAGSSLRYPTGFSGAERKVEITGEAYFEVAKDKHKPFIVLVKRSNGNGGEIEVLGTHFNVNAYEDEAAVRTTLLEGSVKVANANGTARLMPGQQLQAVAAGENKVVDGVDMEEIMAWKEGRFQFENTDIKSIMRQLARWYDISVEYSGNTNKHFDGTISRNKNIAAVLEMLELTGEVKFKMEGKKVLVLL